MRRVPTCDVRTWSMGRPERAAVTMRPSLRTLLERLCWTTLWTSAAVIVWFSATNRLSQSDLSDAGADAPSRRGYEVPVQRVRQPETDTLRAVYVAGRAIGTSMFGLFAAIPLLSFGFARLWIMRDARGTFTVRFRNYLAISGTWPVSSFDTLAIFVREDLRFGRRSGLRHHGWVWVAQPQRRSQPSLPMLGQLVYGTDDSGPVFILDRQRHAPSDDPPLPDRVHAFAEAFHRLTGIAAGEPIVAESDLGFGNSGERGIRTTFTTTLGPPTVTRRTYDSIDQIPPEIRSQFDSLVARASEGGDGVYHARSQKFTVVDESGETRVYESVDELPEEIRDRLKRHLR